MNSRNRALLKKSCTLLDEVIDIFETVMEEEINESEKWIPNPNYASNRELLYAISKIRGLQLNVKTCKNSVQEILQ